ncbi:MFS transporter [Nitrincola alkalilacustris]|uniref:MFS transporter n=1 Tax=Nitrincola alkalilacustris TaxID=1571224 RepID=UPI00124F3280|nr:MFS transporter [Nitrincola alkalilacustris]
MLRLIDRSSHATILASLVLTLTLVSDAILYLLLPLYFESFGITLLWVGLLLSANRFVRLLINPWLVQYFQRVGARNATLQAVVLATLASLCFVVIASPWILLLARLLWGCAYALMRLACLHYATEHKASSMKNLGWYTTFQEIGPLLVLLATPWLTLHLSISAVLILASTLCLIALLPALALPKPEKNGVGSARATFPWPTGWHQITFLVCLLFDGVWMVMLAPQLVALDRTTAAALATAALLMVGKRIFNLSVGLITVRFNPFDRLTVWLYGALGLLLISGLLMPGAGIIFASVLAIIGHGLVMILLPKLLADEAIDDTARQLSLNTFTFWRDLAAACGALIAAVLVTQGILDWFYWSVTLLIALLIFRQWRKHRVLPS